MPIQETSIGFPVTRGSGPRSMNAALVFPRTVTKAVAAIRGYQIGYVSEDHQIGILQVELDTQVNANVVVVTGRLGCRDWSGFWDDEYNGAIQVTVFAELEPISAPPPRGDLQIMDLEVNQATQFFRSAEHLDSSNVMPDNSMPLVGGKMTGLRFFVDYDATAGLPPISTLSGEVTLRNSGVTTVLTPLADIAPVRATELDRAQAGHTLNFAVPAAWCRGRLDVSCRVFDAANPAQTSAAFQRTLQFVDVNPLRVYGVGINYTGMGLNLLPPTIASLQTTFNFTRKVWPTGDVLTSGFTTIAFSQNLAGNAANGCGSGFSSLLSQLKDIKGDTDDLVYGLLPTGTPLTGVSGCGGGGAGAGMVGGGVTAAHEAGHAVGRKHAPCDSTPRCDSPQNTDDVYPSYGNYVSDSIGEFGFDPALNRVHDPVTQHDFMGYSGNDWISPYTYRALLSKGDPIAFTPSATRRMSLIMASAAVAHEAPSPGSGRAEWIRRRTPVLFLSLWVDGEKVTLLPSFTYPAYLRRPGPDSDYEAHLEDGDGSVLACVQLQLACAACDHHCGPVELQGEIPWNETAHRLVLLKDGADIESFDIEEPPKLKVNVTNTESGDYRVQWKAVGGAGQLHYLVQWEDYDGTWRGVAPRTTADHLDLPRQFQYARRNVLNLRLLAVHLLNTASEEFEIKTPSADPPIYVNVAFLPAEGIYRAVVTDPVGRSMPSEDLVWYDESGGEIARGADLLLSTTSRQGVATVRPLGAVITAAEGFVLLDHDAGIENDTWGCRPSGETSRKIMRQAGLIQED